MARLRKRQYETFCNAYVQFPNAGEAAEEAGYSYQSRYQQGYRLLRRPQIQRRIRELREELACYEAQSVSVLLAKLETPFKRAIKDGNCNAAVRVIELQAKLNGYLAGLPVYNRDASADATACGQPAQVTAGPSDEARRAALRALARSSARKRARRSARS